MQAAIGEHALLADGRTAALVDPSGNVAWLCWPRVDSSPLLFALLDETRGGVFFVRPSDQGARVVSRRYHPRSLVLETVWQTDSGRLIVDDALAWEGPPSLVRRLRAEGADLEVECGFRPSFDWGRRQTEVHQQGTLLTTRGNGAAVAVTAPQPWDVQDEVATCRLRLDSTSGVMQVVLSDAREADGVGSGLRGVDTTLTAWRRLVSDARGMTCSAVAAQCLDESTLHELLTLSAAVLIGLRQRDGGIVAAPTTSLPQWPASSRTWDYRYCWLRDASLAGVALIRLGLVGTARELGSFLGEVIDDAGIRPVIGVDGRRPPAEMEPGGVSGYRGARPVRVGNAAAGQLQVDVGGEVIEFAAELHRRDALPAVMARGIARVADWIVAHRDDADHGIWEIRGTPRHYTHSRVMAWAGLQHAAALADTGVVSGDSHQWRRCAHALRDAVLAAGPPLGLFEGGGADAALTCAALTGFLDPADAALASTLDAIAQRLGHDGLLDRYEGEQDGLAEPCGSFIFPSFWMATAQAMAGRDAAPFFGAAVAARGRLGLWSEVAHPEERTPLGNYPQVQSHAAFVSAALDA